MTLPEKMKVSTTLPDLSRRRFIGASSTLPIAWSAPVVMMVNLPAHAQASACNADLHVGGPLIGNRFGADSCPEACQASADFAKGQLCEVTETNGPAGVECGCDIELF
jgi:hypothetical protein